MPIKYKQSNSIKTIRRRMYDTCYDVISIKENTAHKQTTCFYKIHNFVNNIGLRCKS